MANTTSLITELLPALNAANTIDLVWWTTDELYNYADETVKHLARRAAVFTDFDSLSAGAGEIANPSGALALLHAASDGASLRSATVAELEALDPGWQTTAGTPKRWTVDLGLGSMRVYPSPASAVQLERIYHANPPAVTFGTPSVAGPAALDGYVAWGILGRARAKEGESMLADVAAHASEHLKLYERVFTAYWGATG